MQVSLLPRVRFLDLVQQRTGEWLGHSPSQVQVLGLGPCDLGQKVDNAEPPCRIGGEPCLAVAAANSKSPASRTLKTGLRAAFDGPRLLPKER
jgi:hypothetical protein